MKYSTEERLAIGQKIYEHELNKESAALLYGISAESARNYYRQYKTLIELAENTDLKKIKEKPLELDYNKMSRQQLIEVLNHLSK